MEICAGDKGQVGGGGFQGVESCLEHHGSLEECPGFWEKMEEKNSKFRFSKPPTSFVNLLLLCN